MYDNKIVAGLIYEDRSGNKFLGLGTTQYDGLSLVATKPQESIVEITYSSVSETNLVSKFKLGELIKYNNEELRANGHYVCYADYMIALGKHQHTSKFERELCSSLFDAYTKVATKYGMYSGHSGLFEHLDKFEEQLYNLTICCALDSYLYMLRDYPYLCWKVTKYLPLICTAPDYDTFLVNCVFCIDLLNDEFIDYN